MKKIILIILFILSLVYSGNIYAWDDCPKGEVNDPYPGECAGYVDTDNDQICDHSQLAPEDRAQTTNIGGLVEEEIVDLGEEITGQELKTKTVEEIALIYKIDTEKFIRELENYFDVKNIKPNFSFQFLHDNYGIDSSSAKTIAKGIVNGDVDLILENSEKKKSDVNDSYKFGIISLALVFLYSLSYSLSKTKKISVIAHRKIWNIVLTLAFLGTGILGILLVLRISYGFIVPLPFNMLFWHVETGIVFSIILIFHIAWHWPYFKNILKKSY